MDFSWHTLILLLVPLLYIQSPMLLHDIFAFECPVVRNMFFSNMITFDGTMKVGWGFLRIEFSSTNIISQVNLDVLISLTKRNICFSPTYYLSTFHKFFLIYLFKYIFFFKVILLYLNPSMLPIYHSIELFLPTWTLKSIYFSPLPIP